MRWVIVSGIVTGGLYAMALGIPDWGREFTRFGLLYGLLALAYGAAMWGTRRMTAGTAHSPASLVKETHLLWVLWGGAILFRCLVLSTSPTLSDDLYRYLWDGKVLLSGTNPYLFPPLAPELSTLRDANWALINNPDLPTIYPPMLILVFAAVGFVSHSVLAWKTAMVGFDLATGLVWMRALSGMGLPRSWVVLYLWHPLVIIEFAGSGHADAVGIFLVTLALLAWMQSRFFGAGMGLVLAGLVKFLPWAAVPYLVRRLGWKWMFLPLAALGFYLPFHLGDVNALGSLGVFASKWRSNDFLFSFLVSGPDPPGEAALLQAKRLAVIGIAVIWFSILVFRRSLPSLYSWSVGTVLLLSPVVHPWYVLWLLPALLFVPHVAWWLWSLTAILAYVPVAGFKENGIWEETFLVKGVEYLPVLLLIPWQIWLEVRRRRGAG